MLDDIPTDGKGNLVLPPLINAHTHCADAGVRPAPGMSLEDLVAPPDGLKHRYLRETPRDVLVSDMRSFSELSHRNGIRAFVDFRENGVEGARMLREASGDAFIMGRPVSPEFNPEEVETLLKIADGIGLPSLTDCGREYTERCAEAARRCGKPFAIHASERVREDMEFIITLEPAFVVHMNQATDSDLRMCADADVPVVVCPRSNRYFGMVPPVSRMLDAGVRIALGTDNAMLCPPDLRPEALFLSGLVPDDGPGTALRILAEGSAAIAGRLGIPIDGMHTLLPIPDGNPASALASDLPASLTDRLRG